MEKTSTKSAEIAAQELKTTVQIPSLETFLKAGVHFGHKPSRWNPKMAEFIYGERGGIHVIDVIQTMQRLSKALAKIEDASHFGNVLFVGTKGQAASIVEQVATENGGFYINTRWPGGLFTNFDVVKKGIERLIHLEEILAAGGKGYVKKEQLLMKREVERLNKVYSGIKLMDRLPKLMVVIDSKVEKNAIKEARIAGVPVVSLVDTNCDPSVIDYPIPANDDSIKSIRLFMGLFGDAIKNGKKSQGLVELRKTYYAKLDSIKAEYDNEIEKVKAMEEEERLRVKRLRIGSESETRASKKELSEDILNLGLGTRIEKALLEAEVTTLDDLKKMAKSEISAIKGLGAKAVEDITKALGK